MIELKGVSKRFGDVIALESVDVAVGEGEVVVLIGPSGSGKSTLLRCVNALEIPDAGEVTLAGRVIDAEDAGIDSGRAVQSLEALVRATAAAEDESAR